MIRPTAALYVRFESCHDPPKLRSVCMADLQRFRDIPGLLQKYYMTDQKSGAISGFYLFDTVASRGAFLHSDLAKSNPMRYGIIEGTLRIEHYDVDIVLI